MSDNNLNKIDNTVDNTVDNNITADNNNVSNKQTVNNDDKLNYVVNITGDVIEKILKSPSQGDEEKVKLAVATGTEIAKKQLYPEIEKLRAKLATLEKELENKSKDSVDKNVLDRLSTEKTELESKLKIVEDELVKTVSIINDLQNKFNQSQLLAYKNQKVAELGGRVVESLIKGNTKEEIDASIEVAKKEYERIEESLKKEYRLPTIPVDTEPKQEPVEVKRIIEPTRENLNDWSQRRNEILQKVYADARKKLGYE